MIWNHLKWLWRTFWDRSRPWKSTLAYALINLYLVAGVLGVGLVLAGLHLAAKVLR